MTNNGEPVPWTALTRLREERGMTKTDLAFAARIHPSHLAKLELGIVKPRVESLTKIADGLDIPLAKLPRPGQDFPPSLEPPITEARVREIVAEMLAAQTK